MSIVLIVTPDDYYKNQKNWKKNPKINIKIHYTHRQDYVLKYDLYETDYIKLNDYISHELNLPINCNINSIDIIIEENNFEHIYSFDFSIDTTFYKQSNSIDIKVFKGIKIPKLILNNYSANTHRRNEIGCNII